MNAKGIQVAVTGLGMVTAAGLGGDAAWKAVCGCGPLARTVPELAGLTVDIACTVPDFDPVGRLGATLVRRTDRCSQLILVAAQDAVRDAGLDPGLWDGARVAVVVGSAFGGIGTVEAEAAKLMRGRNVSPVTIPRFIPNMPAGQLSLLLGAGGPSFAVSTACASGATALGVARGLLLADRCDIVIAGGGDAPVNRLVTAGFARMDALSRRCDDPAGASRPFDAERDGFVLAEGAAMLVLERRADAIARGARPLAEFAGEGASADAYHFTSPPPDGAGLERAVRAALAEADASPDDVDHVNVHATSTPLGDAVEAALLARLFGGRPLITAAKGVLGHSMGAAGAIEAALTVLAITEGTVPPIANFRNAEGDWDLRFVTGRPKPHRTRLALSNSVGFGGQNAVLAFRPF
jgi:3-oxoacyl-(acyl-carrier-protein) synthase